MATTANASPLIEGFLSQTHEYGLICIATDGAITAWLGAASEIFGYRSDEVVGRPSGLLFTPEDRAKGIDRQELEVALRNSRSEDDRWHVRRDGSRIWVSGAVQAIRDAGGGCIGFVKVVRDRTDLHTWTERLEQQQASSAEAARRTQAFLRTLGHEMRNPLAPLQNAVHILRRATADARLLKVADIIDSQVAALGRMADDLMEVTRLDTGKVILHLERVDVRELVRDACTGFQDTARQKGLELISITPSGPLHAELDAQRFSQVISNLLTNAIKYTPSGGYVWLKATQEADEIVLRVQDTGVGIAPEKLPELFELFTRDSKAEEMDPSGLGIGLSVAKSVVELHGGSIQARSSGPGKGSEFTVRFPAAEPVAEESPAAHPPS
jgi:PAS domain S-box-containing protein